MRLQLPQWVEIECIKEHFIYYTNLSYSQSVQLELREAEIETLEGMSAELNLQVGTLQAERDRLFNLWKDENRRRHEAENRPAVGSWIAWSVAAVAAALALGFGIAAFSK